MFNTQKNLLRNLIFFFLSLSLFVLQANCKTIIDLSRNRWTFHQKGQAQLFKAHVPGCVQTDLLADGQIPDPYFRTNEDSLQWIGEKDWVYQTQFKVKPSLLKHANIELLFKGLDTFAHVFLNDSLILKADNFFRQWRVDVKKYLHPGLNRLRIEFTSPIKVAKQKQAQSAIHWPDLYVYTRKPAYHFGWDWGPVFVTQGIWQPILLQAWDKARIRGLQIRQNKLNDTLADLSLEFEIEADRDLKATLRAECTNTGKIKRQPVTLHRGLNTVRIPFRIDHPKRWWTNGLGQPYLYRFTGELSLKGNRLDSIRRRTGLRTLKLVQKPDSLGTSFYFRLNGVPVFMKGANYIPQDMFVTRPTEETYRQTIQNAKAAHMNMLRVWGGGFYEKDLFYDLCDENGILIWQDFMFACAMYPGNAHFLENVKQEVIQNVKRLRNHPSVALWCGNNENYIGWKHWGWPKRYSKEDSARLWHDYQKLFRQLIPGVLKKYDPERPYWPSSPLTNWDTLAYAGGDVHYWGIWHGQLPFEEFTRKKNIGRFMSEYGFQSCPEMSSVKKFTIPKDWDIHSKVMLTHEKHRIGYPVIDKYIRWYCNWPKDFQAYLYVSQALQAFGIDMAIEAHRRAMPLCMGTLYWQLNDCYPVTSWSSVDYYGKWKALHYRVRNLYKPLLVSPVINNRQIEIYVVSDRLQTVPATLEMNLYDFTGQRLNSIKKKIKVLPNASRIYFKSSVNAILNGHANKADVVLVAKLVQRGKVLAENHFFFVYPRDLQLTRPEIKYAVKKVNDGYELTFSANVFAKSVFLATKDGSGFFSHNFFDLIPGHPVKTVLRIKKNVSDVKKLIEVYSLADSYLP